MSTPPITCKIEHHAILFALLSKHAVTLCGEAGKAAILNGVTRYGRERGKRMRDNALADGEELNLVTYQLYGEWVPEFPKQMETGILQKGPSFQNWVAKCPWCQAWNKHHLLEYGKLYCVNIDKAVYEGFHEDFQCTLLGDNLSFGGERCLFDWQFPLSEQDEIDLNEKRQKLGTSRTRDFTFHTAHLLLSVGDTLEKELGEHGHTAVSGAVQEYIRLFGSDYYNVLF